MRLDTILRSLVDRWGSFAALGEAIGVSASRLSRLARGEGSLEILNCLRLAQCSGLSPSQILDAAGKGEAARLIETLYHSEGRAAVELPLLKDQQEVLDLWTAVNPRHRPAVLEGFRQFCELAVAATALEVTEADLRARLARARARQPRESTPRTAPRDRPPRSPSDTSRVIPPATDTPTMPPPRPRSEAE